MGRKNGIRAAYRIKQNNLAAEYTAPEMAFAELFKGLVLKPPAIHTIAEDGGSWDFRPDFQFIDTNLLVEVQGKYHGTKKQERKTNWRNSQLLALGYRVLEIDAELLTAKKHHLHVLQCTNAFLKGDRAKEHLYA